MLIEVKTVNIKKEDIQNTIEFWGRFAWELKSSYPLNRTDGNYDKSRYIKLVFERDKNIPNYNRIVELEHQYMELSKKLPKRRFDNLKNYALYFCNDYRNGTEKAIMIAVRTALLIAAFFAISEEVLFITLLIAFAATFVFGSGLKDKALENNISDSESGVCKAYRKYLNDIITIDSICNELCILH